MDDCKLNFLVLGGDLRQVRLVELLTKAKHHVKVYGFENVEFCEEVEQLDELHKEKLMDINIFVGPLPLTHDGIHLNTKFIGKKIPLTYIFENIPQDKLFLAGKIDEPIERMAGQYDIKTVDILKREELAVLNVIPTAEGAIQIAMENMETTLHGSEILILGFGRIGKVLAKMLFGIGAEVTVEARKLHDLAWIEAYGFRALPLNKLERELGKFDVIFNTIPHLILDAQKLQLVKSDVLIIDLSSTPGGVDFEYAKEHHIRSMLCLSLPGKVAPTTAAEIIKNTLLAVYDEMEGH